MVDITQIELPALADAEKVFDIEGFADMADSLCQHFVLGKTGNFFHERDWMECCQLVVVERERFFAA